MRHQMKEGGGDLSDGNPGGALLRKLVSVKGSGDNTIKGLDNRMTFSDAEILTQVKG